jgi:hypothetical protein
MILEVPISSKWNQRIMFVNFDGKPVYAFRPSSLPSGNFYLKFEVEGVPPSPGKHVLEIVTERGDYLRTEINL